MTEAEVRELSKRVLAQIDQDCIAYRKTEEYRNAKRELARIYVRDDRDADPIDTTHMATSDYDWLSRRGE